jgi:Fur family iron response transcriptional regulator
MNQARPGAHNVIALLRAASLRPTRQRQALARLLFAGGDRHVTAEQLHGESRTAGASMSLATVYNTLHQFTRVGLLRELVVDSGCSYFDTNISHHHHFFDERVGDLIDISGDSVQIATLPEAPKGKVISRVDVIVRLRDAD